ncbi:MAG: hypothetical protein ACYCW6_02035 [Candidatus Xenobia bacterium]
MKRAVVALCLLLATLHAWADGLSSEERIERYRKTEVTVQVADDQGHEVPGAQVELRQTAHAFIFGGPRGAAPFNQPLPAATPQPAGHTYAEHLEHLAARHKLPRVVALDAPGDDWDLADLPEICDRFSHYARPLQVWVGRQPATADAVEQLYTLLFSTPSVGAIEWRDVQTLSPEILARLQTLVRHRWWSDARGNADASGCFVARVFYGDYVISVTASDGRHRTRTFTFPANSGPHRIVVVLSPETGTSRPAESLSSR